MDEGKVAEAIRGSARGSLILLVGQAASTLAQALGIILIARALGATSFGVVSVAYIPVSIAHILLNTGVNSALIKYLAKYRAEDKPSHRKTLIETGTLINLTVGAALTLAVYTSSDYVAETLLSQPGLGPFIKLYSHTIIGQAILNTTYSALVGYEKMTPQSTINVLYSFTRSAAGPILVYLGLGPIGAILGDVSSIYIAALTGLIILVTLWRREPKGSGFNHLDCAALMVSYGYPLFLSNLLVGLTPNINNFLLALHVTTEQIGNYQAAARFSALVTFFTSPIATVMLPLYSKLEKNPDALSLIFKNTMKYVSLIVFPIVAAVIALAPEIVSALYAEGYQYTDRYMRLYMVHFIFTALGVGAVSLLNALRNTRVVFTSSLINFTVTIPLGLIIIPRLGVTGLLASITLGPAAALAYKLWWIKANLGYTFDPASTTKTLLAASAGATATLLLASRLHLNPWITLTIGGTLFVTVYATSIILLKTLTHQDLDNLTSIATGLGPLSRPLKHVLKLLKQVI